MHVRALHLRNLLSHDDTRLNLPDRGLVLVTGPNGAGKSSFCECVSVAGWGKTLRGTPAWRTGADSVAAIEVDNLMVKRSKNGAKSPSLDWFDPDAVEETPQYTTPTKAQYALEAVIGTWDVWRRSHVFSSSDAAHFTLATDGERKRLLEAVLGLDRFDDGLKACRLDLKAAKDKCVVKRHELERHKMLLQGHEQRKTDATQALELLGKKPTAQLSILDEAAIQQVERDMVATRVEMIDGRATLDEDRTLVTEAGAAARSARARMQRLNHDQCPTCEQPITVTLKERVLTETTAAESKAAALHKELDAAMLDQRAAVQELEEDLDALQRKRVKLVQQRAREVVEADQVKKWDEQKKHHDLKLAQGKLGVKALHKDIARIERELVLADKHRDTLAACETVLGLKGPRAHVLGTALGGLETVANEWLVRMRRPDLQLQLRPYSSTKKGDVRDAIGLEVHGAGDGHGYKATSGGERRRIDVALVLALAEVAGAAHGRDTGTLWFDEVFDCLDEDGADAVAQAIGDLAEDRCVVVITHSKALAQLLPATQHLRVEAGEVRFAA